jgi:hypothetical protein
MIRHSHSEGLNPKYALFSKSRGGHVCPTAIGLRNNFQITIEISDCFFFLRLAILDFLYSLSDLLKFIGLKTGDLYLISCLFSRIFLHFNDFFVISTKAFWHLFYFYFPAEAGWKPCCYCLPLLLLFLVLFLKFLAFRLFLESLLLVASLPNINPNVN